MLTLSTTGWCIDTCTNDPELRPLALSIYGAFVRIRLHRSPRGEPSGGWSWMERPTTPQNTSSYDYCVIYHSGMAVSSVRSGGGLFMLSDGVVRRGLVWYHKT